jgi:hypothetical protein
MKTIQTENFIKLSKYYDRGPSVDDQPGFVNRDNEGQGTAILLDNASPESEEDIKKRWKRRKRRKIKTEKMPQGSI